MTKHTIVILIDHKGRDLMGAALIAHHLEKLGHRVNLDPVESYKAVINARKPSMVLLNQLGHKNFTDYSVQLNKWGILVGVLLNEGLCLKEEVREYLSKPQFDEHHCDLFLTWNHTHKDALIKHKFVTPTENTITVGSPRFDFYREPWKKVFQKNSDDPGSPVASGKTKVLLNTTFATAHFFDRSEKDQKVLFGLLGSGKVEHLADHKAIIKAHYDGLVKVPQYLAPLLESGDYDITIRPHPREELTFYEKFIDQLPSEQQSLIRIDKETPIQNAIIASDIIINCEDCTTSVESWISGKPTVTLAFAKHPLFFTKLYIERAPVIEDPGDLIPTLQNALQNPDQQDFRQLRNEYLHEWLYKVDGQSSLRAANTIHELLQDRNPKPNFPKDFSSFRRAIKMRILQAIDEPSHARLSHILKRRFNCFGENITLKDREYQKAVTPKEAKKAVALINKVAAKPDTD